MLPTDERVIHTAFIVINNTILLRVGANYLYLNKTRVN